MVKVKKSQRVKPVKPWFNSVQVLDFGNSESVVVSFLLDGLSQEVKQQRTALARVSGRWIIGNKAVRAIRTDQNCGCQKLKQLLAKGQVHVTIDGEKMTTAEAIALYLVNAFPQLVASSKEAPVVMTFPTNSPAAVVEATMNALRSAGITLMTYPQSEERVFAVDEGTAFLTSGIKESSLVLEKNDRVLGLDVGGYTGDVTVAKVIIREGHVVLDQENRKGSSGLGGIRFDELLHNYIKHLHRLPIGTTEIEGLEAAKAVKITFSDPQVQETTFEVKGASIPVTRSEILVVAKPFFDDLRRVIRLLLDPIDLKKHPITYVIIGGGFANLWAVMPEFKEQIKELCGEAQIHLVEEPEFATAKGAGLLLLQEYGLQNRGPILNSRTNHHIDLFHPGKDDDYWRAIEAGTPMPAESEVKRVVGKDQVRVVETVVIGGTIDWLQPSRFNLPSGHDHLAVTRDYTGIQIFSGESADDLEPNHNFHWTARPEGQERMVHYDKMMDLMQRRAQR